MDNELKKYSFLELEENPALFNEIEMRRFLPVNALVQMAALAVKSCAETIEDSGLQVVSKVKLEVAKYGIFAMFALPEIEWEDDQVQNYDSLSLFGLMGVILDNPAFKQFEKILEASVKDFEEDNSMETVVKNTVSVFAEKSSGILDEALRVLKNIDNEDIEKVIEALTKLTDNPVAKKYMKTLLN